MPELVQIEYFFLISNLLFRLGNHLFDFTQIRPGRSLELRQISDP